MRAAVISGLLAVLLSVVSASDPAPSTAFQSANEAYTAGDYEAAAKGYELAASDLANDPAVHFNLGNAYFRLGRVGPAILEYERALRLDPGDADTRFNLEYARLKTIDRFEEPDRTLVERMLFGFADRTSLSTAVHIAVALYLLICASILLAVIWRRETGRRNLMLIVAALLAAAFLIYGPFLYAKVHRDVLTDRAVVLETKVPVRSGPGEEFTTLFTVHEGMTLVVHDSRADWSQVTIPSGLSGWVPTASFETVRSGPARAGVH